MKKSLLAVLVAAVLVASFGVVSSVYAYAGTPGPANEAGLQQQLQIEDGLGLYHDEIVAAFSDATGLTVEEIEGQIAEGFTIVEIAQAAGLSFEEIQALMPVGNFAGRNAGWMGRGYMANGDNAEFVPGGQFLGDGTCLVDGEVVPQYLQQGMARGRSW